MKLFGCGKFRRLVSEREDRLLVAREIAYLEEHRKVCASCSLLEAKSYSALNMLRMSTYDIEVDPGFNERVLRRLHVQSGRETVRYWSPALAGAAVACIAVFASLQLISQTSHPVRPEMPSGEAFRFTRPTPELPELDIERLLQVR